MIRRSQRSKDFYVLRDDPPVYVHMNQLYTAWKEDYVQFVLESRAVDTTVTVADPIRDAYVLDLYMRDRQHIVNVAGLSEYQTNRLLRASMENEASMIYKPFFRNRRSHVQGRIHAIYHQRMIPVDHLPSSSQYFLAVLDTKSTLATHIIDGMTHLRATATNEYLRLKMAAMKLYFPIQPSDWIVIHHLKSEAFCFYRPTVHEMDKVRRLVRYTRHAMRWAPAFFHFGVYHDRWLPNMKHECKRWEKEKIAFADRVGEVTRLWGCTVRHRRRALRYGVRSWRQCDAQLLGFRGTKGSVVDAIIRVNRDDCVDWILIHCPSALQRIRALDRETVLFVDFEWIESIYLIGVFDGNEYSAMWTTSTAAPEVENLLTRFMDVAQGKTIVYWYAEKMQWARALRHHKLHDPIRAEQWVDLCAVFRDGIAVKGVFDFKLKHLAEAFWKHGALPYFIDDFACQNGADSIVLAKNYFQTCDPMLRASLEEYNRFDCESMYHMMDHVLGLRC